MGPKAIQWIKSNLVMVICGSLAVLSIAGLALGMILPDAQTRLDADKSVYSNLQTLRAANERGIEDLRREQNAMRLKVQRYLTDAGKTNTHTMLKFASGKDASLLFPTIRPDEPMATREFSDACEAKRKEMLTWLKADDRPDEAYIKEYKDAMDKARQKERLERGESPAAGLMGAGGAGGFAAARPATPAGGFGAAGGGYGAAGGIGGASLGTTPDNMTPEEWVKNNDRAGASVKRAHEVFCYGRPEVLDYRNQVQVGTRYAPVEALWLAQVSLWIQEDIVQSLARLNSEVAGQLSEEDRWVANLPVKHLLYISIGDFQSKTPVPANEVRGTALNATGAATDVTKADAPGAGATFIKPPSNTEGLDLTRVAVGLVIDANYLLRVIDEISKSGFYTPILVHYEAVEPNPTFQDYIYGSAPTIRVRLEFEHCILRDKMVVRKDEKSKEELKYAALIPETIKNGTYVPKPLHADQPSYQPTSPTPMGGDRSGGEGDGGGGERRTFRRGQR
jgi:hypothetical protein